MLPLVLLVLQAKRMKAATRAESSFSVSYSLVSIVRAVISGLQPLWGLHDREGLKGAAGTSTAPPASSARACLASSALVLSLHS